MFPPRCLRGQLSSVLSLLYPRLPGRYQGWAWGFRMGRNIELYWKSADTAPAGVPLQVLVTDGSSESEDYLLPYPCQLTPDGWVNAATGSRLEVRPTRWKPFVETRRAKK